MMGSKAYESPLIPHARMRALFRALVEARVLGESSSRRKTSAGWPRNLEACWVATAVDLKPVDLVSVADGRWLVDHVRALGQRTAAQAASGPEIARALKAQAAQASPGSAISPLDRALCAVGMAQALKARGEGVALSYVAADGLSAAEWKRLLTVAMQGELPLIVVATPSAKAAPGISAIARKMGVSSKIPVIPVDAGDAVAIYRVAQETAVRARADGGVAVIEGIACGTDPIALLASQLVKKKICTERWVTAVEPAFRAALSRVRAGAGL